MSGETYGVSMFDAMTENFAGNAIIVLQYLSRGQWLANTYCAIILSNCQELHVLG
ncbi:MAG: hypothetical protein IKP00_17095 [Victivallales bacterium]|nr:hypothetical protein [Victivallales bacterium]